MRQLTALSCDFIKTDQQSTIEKHQKLYPAHIHRGYRNINAFALQSEIT